MIQIHMVKRYNVGIKGTLSSTNFMFHEDCYLPFRLDWYHLLIDKKPTSGVITVAQSLYICIVHKQI